jgi:hypothetical protein
MWVNVFVNLDKHHRRVELVSTIESNVSSPTISHANMMSSHFLRYRVLTSLEENCWNQNGVTQNPSCISYVGAFSKEFCTFGTDRLYTYPSLVITTLSHSNCEHRSALRASHNRAPFSHIKPIYIGTKKWSKIRGDIIWKKSNKAGKRHHTVNRSRIFIFRSARWITQLKVPSYSSHKNQWVVTPELYPISPLA